MSVVGFHNIVLMFSITFHKVVSGGFWTALNSKLIFCFSKSKKIYIYIMGIQDGRAKMTAVRVTQ